MFLGARDRSITVHYANKQRYRSVLIGFYFRAGPARPAKPMQQPTEVQFGNGSSPSKEIEPTIEGLGGHFGSKHAIRSNEWASAAKTLTNKLVRNGRIFVEKSRS